MKLTFRLRFHTSYGQSLSLSGNHSLLGHDRVEQAVPLQYLDEECSQVTLDFPGDAKPKSEITYHYILRQTDGALIHDADHQLALPPAASTQPEVLVIDSWNPVGAIENVFYTEPFKQVLLKPNQSELRLAARPGATHTFRVKAPLLAKGQTLCLLGNTAALGNWNTAAPLLLTQTAGEDFLTAQAGLNHALFPIVYKYGVYDLEKKTFVRYEDGENRTLNSPAPNTHTVVNDGFARLSATTWKGAGVAIPVFSLRSENSFGVGEFSDLKLLADWGKRVGLKLIQILPVNDTSATHTWADSYPYAAISAFALHPLYLNLSRVATGANKKLLEKMEDERKRLNTLDAVDYEAVMRAKLGFIKEIFPSQQRETFASSDYQEFFQHNQHWLVPYAAFGFFRDQFGTADFNQWPEHQRYSAEAVASLVAENPAARDGLALNFFIQYHLHLQLKEATEHAHANGLIVKGDIAIGVYRHSADVWQQPELYHLDMQAGAPPDAFAVKGQNWGFPTYNWPRMKQDGFAWWKQRFEQMSVYFDAFRIDHILGFFRIWSSPAHAVEGILGYFVPAIPVRESEFTERSIPFHRDRFAKPFITDQVLEEIFGNERETVKRDFLVAETSGQYSLKPGFATQRQVEKHFAALEPTVLNAKFKEGLFDLISNVILFATERPDEFHFRFAMENTASFKNCDSQTQAQLKDLYVDYFFRRQDDFWMQEAMQKLPALKRVTNMLICGEDLGLVPACVPDLMKELGLLGLEIQRMPKQPGLEFSRPADAPYLSVVTPSTHDMSTIRGWWEEDRSFTQRFFNHELGLPGEAPVHCTTAINEAIVRQHLASPAMWSIFQLQDLLGSSAELRRADVTAERINVPANPKYYWRYRLHLSLEGLLRADAFNGPLGELIRRQGR